MKTNFNVSSLLLKNTYYWRCLFVPWDVLYRVSFPYFFFFICYAICYLYRCRWLVFKMLLILDLLTPVSPEKKSYTFCGTPVKRCEYRSSCVFITDWPFERRCIQLIRHIRPAVMRWAVQVGCVLSLDVPLTSGAVPQALTLFGGVGFIARRLRRPF